MAICAQLTNWEFKTGAIDHFRGAIEDSGGAIGASNSPNANKEILVLIRANPKFHCC